MKNKIVGIISVVLGISLLSFALSNLYDFTFLFILKFIMGYLIILGLIIYGVTKILGGQ